MPRAPEFPKFLHPVRYLALSGVQVEPGLRERLGEILAELPPPGSSQDPAATQAAWAVWQAGLTMPFTLPHDLPPLRLLLVWDNLAGHKTPDLVLWLCAHGVMPLYTPVGGSWLNMAELIERVLKRRALDGQHPHSPDEIGCWFEQTARAWNEQPTPFVWNGKRRQRRRRSGGDQTHRLGGSGACTRRHPSKPTDHSIKIPNPTANDLLGQLAEGAQGARTRAAQARAVSPNTPASSRIGRTPLNLPSKS